VELREWTQRGEKKKADVRRATTTWANNSLPFNPLDAPPQRY